MNRRLRLGPPKHTLATSSEMRALTETHEPHGLQVLIGHTNCEAARGSTRSSSLAWRERTRAGENAGLQDLVELLSRQQFAFQNQLGNAAPGQ